MYGPSFAQIWIPINKEYFWLKVVLERKIAKCCQLQKILALLLLSIIWKKNEFRLSKDVLITIVVL